MIMRFLRDETGSTAIEYAVIASLIFIVIVAAVIPLGQALNGIFGQVSAPMEAAAGAAG